MTRGVWCVWGVQEQLAQAEARGGEALQAAEADWERQRTELVARHAAEAEGLRTQLRAAVDERVEAVARSQRRLADLQVHAAGWRLVWLKCV